MRTVEERVTSLEDILADFITHTESALDRLSMEMQEFKEEMREFKEESRADRRSINKQWGALANKMGTLVEDLIAPATGAVIEKYFGCEPLIRTERYRKRLKKGDDFEVDVLVVCEEKVFMIEVRSNPDQQYVNEIIKKAAKFMDFFPEYKDKELTPIFASLIFEDNLIKYATKKGLYLMAYREWDYMDIINFDAVKGTY